MYRVEIAITHPAVLDVRWVNMTYKHLRGASGVAPAGYSRFLGANDNHLF